MLHDRLVSFFTRQPCKDLVDWIHALHNRPSFALLALGAAVHADLRPHFAGEHLAAPPHRHRCRTGGRAHLCGRQHPHLSRNCSLARGFATVSRKGGSGKNQSPGEVILWGRRHVFRMEER